MATFNNGELGSSIRTKLNNVMQHADGTPSTLTFNDAGLDVDVRIESLGQANALFLDGGTANLGIGTATASSKLTVAGDANVAGVATAIAMRDSTNRRITSPGGGSYTTATATVTGAIAITLPVGYTNHMVKMRISVFEYVTQESFDVIVSGYNYSTGPTWQTPSAYIVSNSATDRDFTVRFGFNATSSKCVIYIGELASTWSYPQVNVTDVQLGYTTTGLDAWDDGWAVGFEASAFQNVTQTLTNNRVGARLIGTGQTTAALTDAGARSDLLRLSSVGTAAGTGGGIIFTSSQGDTANSLGMAAIKSLLVSGATNTTGDLAFSTRNAVTDTGLTERMRLTSGGNLGIGTSSPAGKLTVYSTDSSTDDDLIMLGFSTFTPMASIGTHNLDSNSAGIKFSTKSGGTLGERLRIDSFGYVGINTITPASMLTVATADGAVPSNSPGANAIRLRSTTTAGVGVGPSILFEGQTANPTATYSFAAIQGFKASASASDYTGAMAFYTQNAGGSTALTERMRIDGAGNLGLNTTTPVNVGTGYKSLTINDTNAGVLELQAGGVSQFRLFGNSAENRISGLTAVPVVIHTNGTEKMRISSDGNVGIGVTGPTRKFQVLGATGTIAGFAGTTHSIRLESDVTYGLTGAAVSAADTTLFASYQPLIMNGSQLGFAIQGTERLRINSAGAVLIGTTAGRVGNGITPNLQLEGTTAAGTTIMSTRNSADVNPSGIYLAKSRGAALGAVTAVTSGDQIGVINFLGADGTGLIQAAQIVASVDGTPGTNDMPGRLAFFTTPDGTATPQERLRISNNGDVGIGTTSVTPIFGRTVQIGDGTTAASISLLGTGAGTTGDVFLTSAASTATLAARGSTDLLLATNDLERMRVIADGNVSIGWGATPPQKLSILEGNIQLTRTGGAKLFLSDEALTVSVESLPVSATSHMLFKTASTERMRIDSSGNLGLGITPSAWSGAGSVLQTSNFAISTTPGGGTDTSTLVTNAYYNGTNWIYRTGPASATRYDQWAGLHRWFTAPSGTAGNAITFTQAMTLDADGDLGIGITAPSAKLEVRGAALGGTAGDTSLISIFGATDANVSSLRILSYRNATGTSHTTSETRIQRRVDSTDMGYIGFNTTDTVFGYGASTELMRLTSAGSLGIGATPAASAVLDVTSSNKGFLPPRMTTTQRNAISSPAAGLVIYNTTTSREEGYDGTAWVPRIPLDTEEDRIINGGFDIWQRGASSTVSGYGAADRWVNEITGGTVTHSRQSFTVGDTLGMNSPLYFLRQSVTGQTLTSQYAITAQRIEGVRSYAGQTITILGWAKRATAGNIVIEGYQNFGTGGTPSAGVATSSPTTIALTTSWTPFAAVMTVPSISGKTLGTAGNDWFGILFWTSAGSDFNARTNSLGLQTTDVDFWGIHIREGVWNTADTLLYRQKSVVDELDKCYRYYYRVTADNGNARFAIGHNTSTTNAIGLTNFPVRMRIPPTALEQSGTGSQYAVYYLATGAASVNVPTFVQATYMTAMTQITLSTAVLTAGQGSSLGSAAGAGYLAWSAEL